MRDFFKILFLVISLISLTISGLVLGLNSDKNQRAKYNHELYESYVRVTGNPKNIQEVDFIRLKDAKLIKIE